MALTLQCICSPDASVCTLTSLVWNVEVITFNGGGVAMDAENILTLYHSTGAYVQLVSPAAGSYAFSIPLSAVSDWGSIGVSIFMDASAFQKPDPPGSSYFSFGAFYSIDQHYLCINLVTGEASTKTINARAENLGPTEKCQTGDLLRGLVDGGISSILYASTPLGDCLSGGLATNDTTFQPDPSHNTYNIDESGGICLCATGGSGDYTYSIIAGSLAGGQSLNPDTGCIEGTPDGITPATKQITFRVTDLGGGDQTSTGGVTIGGTLRVFGAGATRISGGSWTADMAGSTFAVNGTNVTVLSVTDGDHLTFATTVGIIDPATWSYTSPVVPPPPPGPPETADVTCGYIQGCPSDSSLGGNQAF